MMRRTSVGKYHAPQPLQLEASGSDMGMHRRKSANFRTVCRDQIESVWADRHTSNQVTHNRAEPERPHNRDRKNTQQKQQDRWRQRVYIFHIHSDTKSRCYEAAGDQELPVSHRMEG
jgi:hypothetical protein